MIRVLGPRVLVLRKVEPKPTSSLLVIPETAEEKPSKFALVLGVGKLEQGGIEIGDTVILKDYVGAPITTDFEGERIEAHLVNEDEILAVLED